MPTISTEHLLGAEGLFTKNTDLITILNTHIQGAALRPTIVGDLVPYKSFVIDWQFIH